MMENVKRFGWAVFLLAAWCLLPAAVRAQGTPGTVCSPSQADTADSLFRIEDSSSTKLTAAMTSGSTTINLGSTAGGGSPGGSSGQEEFNNAGSFDGVAGTTNSTDYANLGAAVTAIGSTTTVLTVNAPFALGATPLTVPKTLTLKIVPGGRITGTGNLTINSSLAVNLSNPSRIFDSTVTVTTTVQPALLPEWFGVVGDWNGSTGTDNTTAWATVTRTASRSKAARILLQPNSYLGRVSIPAASGEWQSIEIDGPMHPGFLQGTVNGGNTPTTHGAILVSTGSGGAVVSAAGAYNGTVTLKNLTLRTYDNPNESGFDGTNMVQAVLEGVQVDTGLYTSSVTEPTHSTAKGIIFPPINNGSLNIGRDVLVQGYYDGIVWTEHTHLDYTQVAACENAIRLPGAYQSLSAGRILLTNSKYGLTFDNSQGPSSYVVIDELQIEHGVNAGFPVWQAPVADINDPSSLGKGFINYATLNAGSGTFVNLIIKGAAGLYSGIRSLNTLGSETIINTASGQRADLSYQRANVPKWHLGNDTSDNLNLLNSDANSNVERLKITQAGVGTLTGRLGIGIAPVSGAFLQVKTGSGNDLVIGDHLTLSDGPIISAANDDGSAGKGLELRASNMAFTTSGTSALYINSSQIFQLGGTTNAFAAFKRNGTTVAFRLADDSADASISASTATLSGNLKIGRGTFTLTNGANDNVALPATAYVTFNGPTGAYNVTGFANASDGRVLIAYFNVAQTLTLKHDNSGSSAGQRITLPGGADKTFAAGSLVRCIFIYDQSVGGGTGFWVLFSAIDSTNF